MLNCCWNDLVRACGLIAKDLASCHDKDQEATALEMGWCLVRESVSLQSLLLGCFVGLGKNASFLHLRCQFGKAANSAKSHHLCLRRIGMLLVPYLHRGKYSQNPSRC